MNKLREEVIQTNEIGKKKEMEEGPKASYGYLFILNIIFYFGFFFI